MASRVRGWILVLLVLMLLAGLPLAVFLDLRNLSDRALTLQAGDLNSLITSIREYYAANIVSRVLSTSGHSEVVHNYHEVPGAIPIPATLSLELGHLIGQQQSNIGYRFVSDYPFKGRTAHPLDAFEQSALAALRQNPRQSFTDIVWNGFTGRIRLIFPVLMEGACVGCHNTHPDSPKRDWRVGDVRGIQEVSVMATMASNIFAYRYLLAYFAVMAVLGFGFVLVQRRLTATIEDVNRRLTEANHFLADIAAKTSRYLAPQVFSRIFSGQKDVAIQTERKKLTIFFSDIKDFTAKAERLQPEEITSLLNEYLTAMSGIAARHGGTVDKFIGDAIVIFFGDPETKGAAEDARACIAMAMDMQREVGKLNVQWRRRGIEEPLRVRTGINTGFCDVGNFGSTDRMDYTIIGAEANLAARLQSIAEPGTIVISYETHALVRDFVSARALPPISVVGSRREIVPYVVEGVLDGNGVKTPTFSEHMTGLDFYLDPSAIDDQSSTRIRKLLSDALAAIDRRKT
jgi:class 3 adenylate cyclase